ncbi:MAG: GNAT family N-acetyltransferase [Bacteroidia bacterium]
MNTSIHIRWATQADMPAVYALIRELAIYEQAEAEHSCSLEQLIADGFGPQPAFECFVAECSGMVSGMALFYTKYSTWKGKCIYLEDIVVRETFRGQGIGKALMKRLITLAAERKAGRLEWQVLDWNAPAIAFYKSLGAHLDAEWLNCKLSFEQLQGIRAEKP